MTEHLHAPSLEQGQKPVNEAGKLVRGGERILWQIVHHRTDGAPDEMVGQHEDKDVALAECERLNAEAGALGQQGEHLLEPVKVLATDDPGDSLANLDGPIVSSEAVDGNTLERGERPEGTIIHP